MAENNSRGQRKAASRICGATESGCESKGKSWLGGHLRSGLRPGMRTGIVGAAGFLHGSEFHQFDTGVVRVVEIELPFAVAADLGFLCESHAVLQELLLGGVDVRDTERDVIHDAEFFLVGV